MFLTIKLGEIIFTMVKNLILKILFIEILITLPKSFKSKKNDFE